MNHKAIYNTHPEVKTIIDNEDNTVTCYDANGNIVNINKSDIEAKMTELQAEYDANEYQRDRQKEYPSIAEQLDDLYHNGIDGWKATIKTTKDKYPKE